MTMILIFAASLAWADGISYATYANFEDEWKLITVRYRTDTREQRFVWANPLAVETLAKGSADFPDGAVFAKIGFATEQDPAFPSSLVPSGSKRYQFMVRDRAKYKNTGGWGYALLDGEKAPGAVDQNAQAQACFACHQLVTNRGQVFSAPLKISAFAAKPQTTPAAPEVNAVKFSDLERHKISADLKKYLPKVRWIRSVTGELRKYVFKGTIDEIRPALIDEAKRTGKPAALISDRTPQFAAVYPAPLKNCAKGRGFKSVFSTQVLSQEGSDFQVVASQDLCL